VHIERIDPLDLDLEAADALAAVGNQALEADGVGLPGQSGPALLKLLQLQSDGRPVDGVWVARDDAGEAVGRAFLTLPHAENTDTAHLRGAVVPAARRGGTGRALLEEALAVARAAGRTKVYAGSFAGSPGGAALTALGFTDLGTVDAIRRVDVDAAGAQRWYDEAGARSGDYDLIRLVGPTPQPMLADLVGLHAAINDAPLDDPDLEESVWTRERVAAYDRAMAGRSQTVYRVLARHRASGEWAGMSVLCVDEFAPSTAFQEDTSVVRAHRGHRLGLRLKADMLRWLARERPEVVASLTWNATSNHHMIAVNELLGATVVARHLNFRLHLEHP
jgi:GNAT superfamily N-acetyltransferase